MSTVAIVNYLVWGVSIALIAWMIVDAIKVETSYDQELLLSSVEGEIEKEVIAEEMHGVDIEPHHALHHQQGVGA